jgi:hypothetical protein
VKSKDGSLITGGICADDLRRLAAYTPLELSVNPNPSAGKAYVKIELQKGEVYSLEITNIQGVKAFGYLGKSSGADTIAIPSYLPEGVYFIKATAHGISKSVKFIKGE